MDELVHENQHSDFEDENDDEISFDEESLFDGFRSILSAQKKMVSVSIGSSVFTLLSLLAGVVTFYQTESVMLSIIVFLVGLTVTAVVAWVLIGWVFKNVFDNFLDGFEGFFDE